MPKLWNETIEAHRRDVRVAIMDTTAALVAENGLLSVTMSQIAEQAGIGRATLYKYFPDVEAILAAWHGGHVNSHLERLGAVRDQVPDPGRHLEAVATAYAQIAYGRAQQNHSTDLSALLHRDEHVAQAQRQIHELFRGVLADAMAAGQVRVDVASDELALYCLHALSAARDLPDAEAVQRLVALTLTALRPLP